MTKMAKINRYAINKMTNKNVKIITKKVRNDQDIKVRDIGKGTK